MYLYECMYKFAYIRICTLKFEHNINIIYVMRTYSEDVQVILIRTFKPRLIVAIW